MTFGPAADMFPVWYPGDERFMFVSVRDGKRFVMFKENAQDQRSGSTATMRLVLNWAEELKGKLPSM